MELLISEMNTHVLKPLRGLLQGSKLKIMGHIFVNRTPLILVTEIHKILKAIYDYRDNQRRGGLYHEIIYEAEVVYHINDRGVAEVSLSDKRPKLNRLFHDKDRLASDYPYCVLNMLLFEEL